MVLLNSIADITWENVQAVAYDREKLVVSDALLAQVEDGRQAFQQLIDDGVPCYGVTTGLGHLVTLSLSDEEREDLPHNILRARAAAIGKPLPQEVVRSLMMLRLTNFCSGLDGVTVELVQFLVDRLNDAFTPWVPSLGHGMAADATAQTHTFQTFIGEGFVWGNDGKRVAAADALAARGASPIKLGKKEGLALLNGISAAPAYALDAYRRLQPLLNVATVVSAVASEGAAAPKDSIDPHLKTVNAQAGTGTIIDQMAHLLRGSQIAKGHLQSPISYRIIPQVHGALLDALEGLRRCTEGAMATFSDNPLMDRGSAEAQGRFLSVGLFHNQHLVNQADHVAVALAHVAALSSRRLHRLLNPKVTGLTPQLALRPGLDAGLVVAHKATIGILSRVKLLANPVSLMTQETSAGQEDYMSMAIPTIARLYEMADLVEMILSYELFAGLTALYRRGETPGEGVQAVQTFFTNKIAPLDRDRSPGPDVEVVWGWVRSAEFRMLVQNLNPKKREQA